MQVRLQTIAQWTIALCGICALPAANAFCPGAKQAAPFEAYEGYCRLSADLDGDKVQDLVFVGAASTFTLLGIGDGRYAERIQALSYPDRRYEGYEVRLEDRNGDGRHDLVFIGAANFFSHAGSKQGTFADARDELPCNEVFASSAGLACKFATTVSKVDSTKPGKDLFNLPSEVMVSSWSRTPGVGWVVEQAWNQDPKNRRVYRATLKAPPEYSTYVYCKTNVVYHSINPQGGKLRVSYGWTYHGNNEGTFAWRLLRQDLYEGATWFKADIYWFTVHPEYAARARTAGACESPRGNLKAPF